MNTVIYGRFDGMAGARHAIDALAAAGFAQEQIASVAVAHVLDADPESAPGRSDDDAHEESTSEQNAGDGGITGTLKGIGIGAAVGLVGFPVLGPLAPLGGAAVGAYVGSLAGALAATDAVPAQVAALEVVPADDGGTHAQSDLLVAVAAPSTTEQESAITVLRAHGAAAVRSVEGNISGGQWLDFDSTRN